MDSTIHRKKKRTDDPERPEVVDDDDDDDDDDDGGGTWSPRPWMPMSVSHRPRDRLSTIRSQPGSSLHCCSAVEVQSNLKAC